MLRSMQIWDTSLDDGQRVKVRDRAVYRARRAKLARFFNCSVPIQHAYVEDEETSTCRQVRNIDVRYYCTEFLNGTFITSNA